MYNTSSAPLKSEWWFASGLTAVIRVVFLTLSIFHPLHHFFRSSSLKPGALTTKVSALSFSLPTHLQLLRPSLLTPGQSFNNNWRGQSSMAQAVFLVKNPLLCNTGRLTALPPSNLLPIGSSLHAITKITPISQRQKSPPLPGTGFLWRSLPHTLL